MTKPLRILIDARMLIGRFSGVARFVTSLVDELARFEDLHIMALCGKDVFAPWAHRRDIEIIQSDFDRRRRTPARRLLWEACRLRGWIAKAEADVFHASWNQGIPPFCPCPSVLTLHDLIGWEKSERSFSSRWQLACRRSSIRASVRRAHSIATVSSFTRDQLTQTVRCDKGSIRVIPNGTKMRPPPGKRPEQSSYVLYVGGHEDRKNVDLVLLAMEEYWERFDPKVELRLTGLPESLSPRARSVYQRLGDRPIRFLGEPRDESLVGEYANAGALLFLSRAEGFGLPALEAMACGCPVIAARAGALPEVVGDAGVLVDAEHSGEIAATIHTIFRSSHYAQGLSRLGRGRASAFTWGAVAAAYREAYRAAAMARANNEDRTSNFEREDMCFTALATPNSAIARIGRS